MTDPAPSDSIVPKAVLTIPECLFCRYDLSGTSPHGVCPECGTWVGETRPGDLPPSAAANANLPPAIPRCLFCWYDLAGTPPDGVCPECGTQVGELLPQPPRPALLCESCGYDLSETPPDRACPECGTAAALSQPERRDLTIRHPTIWSVARAMLNAPRAAARAAEIDDPLIRRCGLASQIAASSLVAIMAMVPLVFYHDEIPAFAIAWLPFLGIALFLTIGGLTVIESIGIRFFGRQRGWRITHDVAWTVCSLASIGWFIGACVCALGIALIHLGGMQHQRLIDSRHLPDFIDVGAIVAIAGALIGLLYFELLVYLGIRQCRFANPPGVRRYSAAGGSSGPVRIQRADSQQ